MTTEELAAAGLPAEPVVHNPENAQPPEEEGSPAASESRSHEDGEVRTDDEDVGDVDADVRDLVRTRSAGPLPPSFVFGECKVTAVNTTEFNHWAVGIRSCENAFHLASAILGGRDIVEEFVAARIWPISYGWAPSEIVHFNVYWASQEVPFPKFGIKLREGQSADAFILEVEKRVTLMIDKYTMNEYKTYKALVKHKRKINRVFSKVCGDKAFPSRRPGRKLKIPAFAVASCSVAPPKAPRRRSSKSGPATADEITTSGVQPSKTKSLESSKRKRRTSEEVSDAELQAASSLAQMSRKKSKKVVRKVVSSGVRRVPVTEPPKIVPYYRLSLSTWPLSNNKELLSRFRRVKPGKSHTTGSLICAKPTRRRDQSTTLHYIKVHKFNIIINQVFRT
jgi:hypothetical protein